MSPLEVSRATVRKVEVPTWRSVRACVRACVVSMRTIVLLLRRGGASALCIRVLFCPGGRGWRRGRLPRESKRVKGRMRRAARRAGWRREQRRR